MAIRDICTHNVIVSHEDTPVDEVAHLMRSTHVGTVVVVRNSTLHREPVGIISDRDLVIEVMAAGVDPRLITARDIMTRNPVVVHDQDGICPTMERMRKHGIRRVPVVNDRGSLVGLLSMDDMVEFLAHELNSIAVLIHEQPLEEQRLRA